MRVYYKIQLLSIDIAVGACAMAFLVAKIVSIQLPFIIYFSLASCVWLIYTLDHLIDAKKIGKKTVTPRHRFHFAYFNLLTAVWLFVFVFAGVLSISYLPINTLRFGSFVVGLVLIHLVLVNLVGSKISVLIQKELVIAIVYTTGVLIGPLSLVEKVPPFLWWVLAQIFLYAFINLLAFSYFEKEIDKKQNQTSIARSVGADSLATIINLLLIVGLAMNVYCFVLYPDFMLFQAIFLLIFGVLSLLFFQKRWFAQHERYRFWGDVVFMFPVVLVLV